MTLPDTDSISTYGGALNDSAPIEDPTTDRPAAGANQAYASVAMMTLTAPRAYCRFTAAATTGAMALVSHYALWGNAVGDAPTLARTGSGVFTITWATTRNDSLSVAHTLNFRAARGQARSATSYHVQCVPTSANVVTVYVTDMAGAATDAVGIGIEVWVD